MGWSSDLEFSSPPKAAVRGQQSIDALLETALTDRVESKKLYKTLSFASVGAPGTQVMRELWISRFNAFRTHTLGHDLKKPFTGEDLFRFFGSVVKHLKGRGYNTKLPNLRTLENGIKVLTYYGTYTYSTKDGYEFTKQHQARIKVLWDDLIKSSQAIKGRSRKQSWLGYRTLEHMIRTFIEDATSNGTYNWDVTIAKCLSVVLPAATVSRSGDVARTSAYTGEEYLKWEDVRLYVEEVHNELHVGGDRRISLLSVRAEIDKHFAKGFKDKENTTFTWYGRTLPVDSHMCPISLLLVHALRHGLVQGGTTLEQVLRYAAARSDKQITWTQPRYPVLAQFEKMGRDIVLNQPARTDQLLRSIKQMGRLAGVKDRVYMHAIRAGGIRDMAHIPKSALETGAASSAGGLSFDFARAGAGHTMETANSGVTDAYVGGMSYEAWNMVATVAPIHKKEPRIATSEAMKTINAPITPAERETWMMNNNSAGGRKNRAYTDMRIREERMSAPTVELEPRSAYSGMGAERRPALYPPHAQQQQKKKTSEPAGPSRKRARDAEDDSVGVGAASTERPAKKTKKRNKTRNATDEDSFTMMLDPALRDQPPAATIMMDATLQDEREEQQQEEGEEEDEELSDEAARALQDTIFSQNDGSHENEQTEPEGEEELMDMLCPLPAPTTTTTTTTSLPSTSNTFGGPDEWVQGFARVNVFLRATMLGRKDANAAQDPTGLPLCMTTGNSRDPPQRFILSCEHCNYSTTVAKDLDSHSRSCNAATAESLQQLHESTAPLSCPQCEYTTYAGPKARSKHMQREHPEEFTEPQPCTKTGCDPNVLYETREDLEAHKKAVHAFPQGYPTPCLHTTCVSSSSSEGNVAATYANIQTLTKHMRKAHEVVLADHPEYLPPDRDQPKVFSPAPCGIDGCNTKPRNRSILVHHVVSVHH
ncbi:unnamed protein product [Cercospora beticola]|nr:unnamed protein product [Cercospora beticola]